MPRSSKPRIIHHRQTRVKVAFASRSLHTECMMSLYSVETYGELRPHLDEEWLITNGIGGFASGTVVGCNTRRYHGLLCAAMLPPVGRIMMLNRLGEIIRVRGRDEITVELSVNQFGDAFHPRGDRYLRRFDLEEALARWEYEIGGIRVIKEIQMPWRNNAVGIRYTVEPGTRTWSFRFCRLSVCWISIPCGTRIRSLTNRTASEAARSAWVPTSWRLWPMLVRFSRIRIGGLGIPMPLKRIAAWTTARIYTRPGRFVMSTSKKASITLWAAVQPVENFNWDHELSRRRGVVKPIPNASPAIQRLLHAADDFVVSRRTPDGQPGFTIIAGYPWFADWGRDTMISLPGLLLYPGRFDEARQVLCVFAQYISEGMIPNRFDDYTNEPSYNTVDASLWFIHAAFEYLRLSGDSATFEKSFVRRATRSSRATRRERDTTSRSIPPTAWSRRAMPTRN